MQPTVVGAAGQQREAVRRQRGVMLTPTAFLLYQPKTQPVERDAHPTGLVWMVPARTPRAFLSPHGKDAMLPS